MTLARWPNEGEWEQIAGFPDAGARKDEHGGKIGKLEEGFTYSGDRPRAVEGHQRPVGPRLLVLGLGQLLRARRLDRPRPAPGQDRRRPTGLYGFRKGQRFYFLNVLEELDQPGEWFLDRKAGVLYFWPPGSGALQEASAPEIALLPSRRAAAASSPTSPTSPSAA